MKDDTVSRVAVMESLTREYNRRRTGDGLKLAWIEKAVDEVPAVQTCEDAVSRAAAIDALMVRDKELRNINWYDKPYAEGECRGIDEALTIVSNLPSVQPEPKPDENGSEPFGNAEMLGDRTTDDCISRQAAIKTLEKGLPSEPLKSKYTEGITVGFGLAITWIEQLPAVQSQRKTDEWCTDCKEYDSEKHCCPRWNRVIRQTLKDAQPELIRCRDCKFQDKGLNESESWNLCKYRPWLHVPTEDEHYCGYAERRTE